MSSRRSAQLTFAICAIRDDSSRLKIASRVVCLRQTTRRDALSPYCVWLTCTSRSRWCTASQSVVPIERTAIFWTASDQSSSPVCCYNIHLSLIQIKSPLQTTTLLPLTDRRDIIPCDLFRALWAFSSRVGRLWAWVVFLCEFIAISASIPVECIYTNTRGRALLTNI